MRATNYGGGGDACSRKRPVLHHRWGRGRSLRSGGRADVHLAGGGVGGRCYAGGIMTRTARVVGSSGGLRIC